jgi:serine/threonine protein kinase
MPHEMTSLTCAGCQSAYAESALFCPNCGRPKDRGAGSDALIGKLLGDRFQVIDRIGQGGSGTIYRAEHVTLRRKVAIKILHDELSRDDLAVERFRREATTVAEIDNEHIVEIHDFGRTPDGRLYLAMELLEGETLDHVLAREKQLSVERAADILIQVGEALMEAHAIGYVHRDLRPRNIYLANRRGKTNFVKLLDFGLAKLVDTDSAQAASTSVGMTFGDPRYMSPEQARGDRIDRRADIYQLGCVCYEMLTGAPPFTGNRVFDILTKQVSEAPAPLPTRRPGVPLWMEAAAAKMLAKDPENRFATTTRMVDALKRGLETGEVMEDEVARRRESVPPPSVSRVMQKMGITPDAGLPRLDPNVTAKGLQPVAAPIPPAPIPPAPVATAPAPRPKAPSPVPGSQVAPKQDSIDLVRKRTGTPQLGVPVSSVEHASSASGTIDGPTPPVPAAKSPAETRARVKSPSAAPAPRGRRPTGDPADSQAWFDEGDEAEVEKPRKKFHSPSITDSLYDDVPRSRGKGPLIAVIGVLVIVGGVAFALTRGGDDSKPTTPEPTTPNVAMIDAGPSQIINETPDAAEAPVTSDASVAVKPNTGGTRPPPAGGGTRLPAPPTTGGPIDPGAFVLGGGNPNTNPTPTPGTGSGTTVVIIPGPPGPGSGVAPTPYDNPGTGPGSGLNGGPVDPYHDGPDANGGGGSAEQFATQGQQQLTNGDATNAAISFKKALELDPNNAVATLGMGDIASRQGLWGAAIGHLTKAARLAPKNAYVFVLLGEAYLRSGNTKDALANFKKALVLDPNSARARDGFNEASAKTPPPTDEE